MEKEKPRRLKLMDSYGAGDDGAFGDNRLEEIKQKIKKISSPETSTDTIPINKPDTTPNIPPNTPPNRNHILEEEKQAKRSNATPNTSPNTSPIETNNRREPVSQSVTQPITQSVATPDTTPITPPDTTPDIKPVCLNENQFILYHCLRMIKGKITTLPLIKKETKISENTLKGNLNKLRKTNVIDYKGRQHAGGNKFGFIGIVLNKPVSLVGDKEHTIKVIKGINYDNLGLTIHSIPDPIPHLTPNLTQDLSPHQTLYSSSSYLNNTTTTKLEQTLNTHPELGYWRQKGLTVKQITGWIETAQCTPEIIIQYLCYCKFDMIDLDQEEGKGIKDVFNWFYKIIEKSGQYRKPKGYKSHQEIQLEAERQLISDREKRIQELKDLHRKKYEQERDLAFWEMMSDPDGDLYKQCFASLSDFAKGQARKGGKAFEAAMRKVFDEMESDNT